jgi:hypothetical protein
MALKTTANLKPMSQDIAYFKATARSRLASWLDVGAAALVFYVFT